MIPIASKQNSTLKHIHSLQLKKNRDAFKEYIIEGYRALSSMVDDPYLKYVVVEEKRGKDWNTLLETLEQRNIPIYASAVPINRQISATETSQGIIGVAKQGDHLFSSFKENKESHLCRKGMYLLLDQVQDPGNVGTVIRTAIAAGVNGIFLTAGSVDVYNPKTVRSAMNGLSLIPIYQNLTMEDVKSLLSDFSLHSYALCPNATAAYHEVPYERPVVLVFGNEGNGIREEIIELCTQTVTIPMKGNIDSLNLSVAAALTMYQVMINS